MKIDYSKIVQHIFKYDYEICQIVKIITGLLIWSICFHVGHEHGEVFNNALMCNMKSVREQMTILNNRQGNCIQQIIEFDR